MTAPQSIERAFRAMNTDWCVLASAPAAARTDVEAALAAAEALVHDAEARYSRFRSDSLLAGLNRLRLVRDPGFVALARAALRFVETTRGAFDPTVGAALVAAGYDRSFELLARLDTAAALPEVRSDARRSRLIVRGDTVALDGEGTLDLGGIAKGWTVDRAGEALEARGVRDYLVDGGGDIRARGLDAGTRDGAPWTVEVGDGLVLALRDRAVATSSTLRRRWRTADRDAHHIVTPETGRPAASAFVTVTVTASDATTADVLATAIIADHERGLAALAACDAEALLCDLEGAWTMTPGFARDLIAPPSIVAFPVEARG